MEISTLFNQSPETIRNKITVYYLGFGTPTANILTPQIRALNVVRNYTSIDKDSIDDLTLWRYKISKLQSDKMKTNNATQGGYIALCDLTIAYSESFACCNSMATIMLRIHHARVLLCLIQRRAIDNLCLTTTHV